MNRFPGNRSTLRDFRREYVVVVFWAVIRNVDYSGVADSKITRSTFRRRPNMRWNRTPGWRGAESAIRRMLVLVLFAVFATHCRPVWAASDIWTRIGLEGVNLAAVAIDPQNPSTVYAANSVSSEPTQIFKSTDGERTGLPFPLCQCQVKGSVRLTPWRLIRKLRAQYTHMAWADYSRAPIAEKAGLTLDSQTV